MAKQRVFITGVAGFLGSHLADAFLADGYEVSGCDNMIGGYLDNVPPEVEFHQADCNDFEKMKDYLRGVDIVYHCAATAYEGLSVFSPHMVTQHIVTASTGVVSAAIANNVRRFVMCSSMARYGTNQVPFTEDMVPRPQDPYGIGKYMSELMLQNLAEVHGMEWVIAVPHNIVGPRQKYEIRNIVILTGAGVSAESGVATFRGPDGLWEGHRVEDVATPEAFRRDPTLVHAFYDARRARLGTVEPNAAHKALARLDAEWPGDLLLVTQNVDDLHERAGSTRLLHMHGELKSGWCLQCDDRFAWDGPMGEAAVCPVCFSSGQVRPDIVWFGEMPYDMERIDEALQRADLFVSIGTSGAVYPAAGFVQTARYCGARTLEMNLEPTIGSTFFEESRIGPAGTLVPEWVEEMLGG